MGVRFQDGMPRPVNSLGFPYTPFGQPKRAGWGLKALVFVTWFSAPLVSVPIVDGMAKALAPPKAGVHLALVTDQYAEIATSEAERAGEAHYLNRYAVAICGVPADFEMWVLGNEERKKNPGAFRVGAQRAFNAVTQWSQEEANRFCNSFMVKE